MLKADLKFKSLKSRTIFLLVWEEKVIGLCPEVRMFQIF